MQKTNFDHEWEFTELSGFAARFNPKAWQPVTLPHDAMIGKPRAAGNPSGNQGGYFPGGVANYRKKFFVPEEWRGQKIQLEFEGVYMQAEVSLNNRLIQTQPYGYSSFIVDLTSYLAFGKENTVGVIANNTAQPNSRWYSGTGIYRHTWLRLGPETLHIQPWGVFVTTPVVEAEACVVQVATELASAVGRPADIPAGAVLRTRVVDGQGKSVAEAQTAIKLFALQQTLLVKQPKLWWVEQPNLYILLSEVWVGEQLADAEKTTFGMRSLTVDAEHGLRLNGVTTKMKGGCIHHDNGPLGAASYDRAEERKVQLLKSAGYNALRTAHNPPAPGLLEACDRLGMLVIDESFDAWTSPKVTNDYHLHFLEWWQRDTEAMVKRDRNHPSVVMWSIGNEIFEALGSPVGVEWSQRQVDFIHSLDSTRPVTSGVMLNFLEDMEHGDPGASFQFKPPAADPQKDSWGNLTRGFIKPLDVAGYNYMPQRYAVDQARFPGRVIAGTETWGHSMYYFWKETERLPHVIGDFVWTAIDYLGEAGGGQVNFDAPGSMRGAGFPYHTSGIGDFNICGFKRVQSYYRDLLWGVRTDPFIAVVDPQHFGKKQGFTPWAWEAVLDTWTFPGQEGQPCQVDIYSSDDEVEVLVNGVSFGRKPAGAVVQNKARFDVVYQPGVIEAVGYRGGQESGRCRLETTGVPARLHLEVDRPDIRAGGGDLAYVTIEIHDAAGRQVKQGEPSIAVEVNGAGELLAIGSGNPNSEELYVGNQHKAFLGRLLAIVRSALQPGAITVIARTEGLPEAVVVLDCGANC